MRCMKLLIQKIPESGRLYEVTDLRPRLAMVLANRPDIVGLREASAEVRIERIDQIVTVRGEARVDLTFVCSRCADELDAVLRFAVRMVLMPRVSRSGPADEDVEVGYHNGRDIDMQKIVLEQIAWKMPDILLCDPHCQGLCPVCKENLNDGPCRCGDKETR